MRCVRAARTGRHDQMAEKYEAQADANLLHANLLREALTTGEDGPQRKEVERVSIEQGTEDHKQQRRGTQRKKKRPVSA